MKKTDIVLALITGEAVAMLFFNILKGIEFLTTFKSLFWILFLIFPVLAVIGLWVTFVIGKKFLFIFQLGKFFLTGSFITVVDLGVLNVLMLIFGIEKGVVYSVFKGISFLVATATKYLLSKFWVFEKTETSVSGTEVSQSFLVAIIGLGINVGAASFLVNIVGTQLGITPNAWANIGGVFAALVSATWNFIGFKFFVFKK